MARTAILILRMKNFKEIASLLVTIMFWLLPMYSSADVYVLIHATYKGKTGHAAIAIDNYRIEIRNHSTNGRRTQVRDTVRLGNLTYFDLWPAQENLTLSDMNRNVKAKYQVIPTASWDVAVTLSRLKAEGIPTQLDNSADGILKISTSASQDYNLKRYLYQLMDKRTNFHVRHFNCADFVEQTLEHILNEEIKAEEYIPFAFSTTPNQLYKSLLNKEGCTIIRDAGPKVDGSFVHQKMIHTAF